MRFVAAFGIVWAHIGAPGMIAGYGALALFITLTAVLTFASIRKHGRHLFLQGRIRRICMPWLGWSLFYLLIEAVQARDIARIWTLTDWHWLLIGPVIHLWYLPFVVLVTLLFLPLVPLLRSPALVRLAVVPAVALAVLSIWLHDQGLLAEPFAQWGFSLTPLLYGLLSAAARGQHAGPVALVFIVAATVPPWLLWGSLIAPWFLASAFLFEAFWRINIRARFLPALGALAYGIYLVHPFFMLVWYRFMGIDGSRVLAAIMVFALSALTAAAIEAARRSNLRAMLVEARDSRFSGGGMN